MRKSLLSSHILNARGINVGDKCIFCRGRKLDSRDQIFFECLSAVEVWPLLLFWPKQHDRVWISFFKKSRGILILSKGVPSLANECAQSDIVQLGLRRKERRPHSTKNQGRT